MRIKQQTETEGEEEQIIRRRQRIKRRKHIKKNEDAKEQNRRNQNEQK